MGRSDHVGVVREAEVVVRAEVQQLAAPLDVDVRALRRRHRQLVLVEALLAELLEPRREVVANSGVHQAAPFQSRSTLPDSPEAATWNASSNSEYGNRCVITCEMSSPESTRTLIWYQVSNISRP